jgi:hypothetical protein
MLVVEDESLAEIDEALGNLQRDLSTDTYGNRMNWRKREMLLWSIDNLLDARSELVQKLKNAANE